MKRIREEGLQPGGSRPVSASPFVVLKKAGVKDDVDRALQRIDSPWILNANYQTNAP